MLIKSKIGKVIVSGTQKGFKKTLEYCAQSGISLEGAILRRANLKLANLDGIVLNHADLWGADLQNADIGYATIKQCDLRNSNLENTCFANSNLKGADFRGAYFKNTIFDESVLEDNLVTCPSFLSCDFSSAYRFHNIRYIHRGEVEIILNQPPITVQGGFGKIVFLNENFVLWGTGLYAQQELPQPAKQILQKLFLALRQYKDMPVFAKRENNLSQR